ncbi:1576_t:CDS:2, partial [Dentiscutata heterogama]
MKEPESEISNLKPSESGIINVKNSESETINVKVPNTVFITLVCYDRFEKSHKKLDWALAILYDFDKIKNFRNIEEEILSRTLPEQWGKIELTDHYDLKADGAIAAFIAEIKYRKSIQL